MSEFYEDLKKSIQEAADFMAGKDTDVVVHHPVDPRAVRERGGLTQAQMAPLMGMSLSGYRKWEQGQRSVSGPALNLLRVIEKNPAAVIDALS